MPYPCRTMFLAAQRLRHKRFTHQDDPSSRCLAVAAAQGIQNPYTAQRQAIAIPINHPHDRVRKSKDINSSKGGSYEGKERKYPGHEDCDSRYYTMFNYGETSQVNLHRPGKKGTKNTPPKNTFNQGYTY